MKTIAKLFDLLVITIFDYLPMAIRAIWRHRQKVWHIGISIYALHLFLSPVFASQERKVNDLLNEPVIEDYTSETKKLHFGDKLKSQIYSLDNEWEILDLDKLAYAVAMAETGDCSKGAGRHNNCFGVMHWPNGKRTLRTYSSKQESYNHFKQIWTKHYKTFPTYAMAKRWTGNDSPNTWLNNVKHYYGI